MGRHTHLGTSTGVDPPGCTPSLAMRSSASMAEVAVKVRGCVVLVLVVSSILQSVESSSLLGSSVVYASS